MKKIPPFIVIFAVFVLTFGIMKAIPEDVQEPRTPVVNPAPTVPVEPPRTTPNLTRTEIADWLSYSEVVDLMKEWEREAPRLCKFGTYGKTSQGTECSYLRMGTEGKPKLLIHACLHGNERLATASSINIMARLLKNYKVSEEETWILYNRDIYFVPVLSPDTYLSRRHVEGVDPNRSYPCPENPNINSPSPVKRIIELCKSNDFSGVISAHTYGRIFLYPRFRSASNIGELAREMGQLANYRAGSIGGGYPTRSRNSRGYEIDLYYILGATAILTEFSDGSPGGHSMPKSKIVSEANRVYPAWLLFMKKAPELEIQVPDEYKRGIVN